MKSTGTWTITWTLTNDHAKQVTISNAKLTPADANAKIPTTIDGKPKDGPDTTVTFTSTAAGSAKTASFNFEAHWADNWPSNGTLPVKSGDVALNGPCVVPSAPPTEGTPSPPASPSASPPAPKTPSPSATPALPVTGSSTTLPMVGTGAALVAGGAALVVTLRRRRRVTFTAE